METVAKQAKAIELGSRTQLGELRELLKRIESQIGTLAYSQPDEVLAIPEMLDQAALALEKLADQGINIGGELARFNAVQARLKRKGAAFLRAIGGVPALEQARQARPDHWWWHIDEVETGRKKAGVKRLLQTGGIGLLILAVLAAIYQLFLAPPPEIRASYGHKLRAENVALKGDLDQALVQVQLGLEYTPDDPELLAMKGVFETLLGQEKAAEASFAASQAAYNDPAQFFIRRSSLYLVCEQADRALDDVEAALAIDPQSALAYMLRGQGYDKLGDYQQASISYKRADELAGQAGDYELQAIVRMHMANMAYPQAAPQTALP